MELRKDYAGIVDANVGGLSDIACERIELVALACQELADRPPRELTDAEILDFWRDNGHLDYAPFCRKMEAAIHAKQREPATVTVKVRFYRWRDGQTNCVSELDASLDANFPFGNPVYKWIGDAFEITREVA